MKSDHVLILAPGDVVCQPDGSPMTVDRVDGENVHCVWFVVGQLMRGCFTLQQLGRPQFSTDQRFLMDMDREAIPVTPVKPESI